MTSARVLSWLFPEILVVPRPPVTVAAVATVISEGAFPLLHYHRATVLLTFYRNGALVGAASVDVVSN